MTTLSAFDFNGVNILMDVIIEIKFRHKQYFKLSIKIIVSLKDYR